MIKPFIFPTAIGAALFFCTLNSSASPPAYDHVVIVVEENHSYNQITNQYASSAPYINQTLIPQGASLTQMYAEEHASEGNYLWMFSGSNQGIGYTDPCPVGPFNTPNLGASLIGAGQSFKGYSEDLPAIGSTVCTSGLYARKHSPWVDFSNVPNGNSVATSSNLRMADFPTDFTQLPTVSIVIPNQANDMHNGSNPATVATGDAWLQSKLDAYYQWAKTHNSLLIVTFDEDSTTGALGMTNPATGANRVVTVMAGAGIAPGAYAEGPGVNHVNMLRTLEDMYALPHAGGQTALATAAGFTDAAITDIFVQWQNASDGSWNDPANWVGYTVPNGAGAVANLPSNIPTERTITIDNPVTINVLNIDNTGRYNVTGPSTLTLGGVIDATSKLRVTSGDHVIDAPLDLQRNTTIDVLPGATLTVSNLSPTTVEISKSGQGKLVVNRIIADALTIDAGTISVTGGASRLSSLALAGNATPTASLDLTSQDAVFTGMSRSAVESMIVSARDGGAWDRNGLTSSAAREQPGHTTTLGVIDGEQFLSVYGPGATFDGFAVSGGDVLVKYTWYGDTDLNGVVNFDDYSRTDSGYNNQGTGGNTGWFHGDFDFNGRVDFDDYSLIDLAFNTQSGTLRRAMSYLDGSDRSDTGMNETSLQFVADHFHQFGNAYASSFLNAVPEPTSTALASVFSMLACRRRRHPTR